MTGIAFLGCGYVADYYHGSLAAHPDLNLCGVYDRQPDRLRRFAGRHGLREYADFDELIHDENVVIVVNLTDPRSHYETSAACLAAGKHVYSEKPLAMEFADARELVATARRCGLWVSSAPCSLLGETAQTLWKAVRERVAGPPRLVYAELDDGMVHRMPHAEWVSPSGAPWPAKDEFEVGCTVEHAGYYASWLPAMFGPVRELTVFGSVQVADKLPGQPLDLTSPDFSVACMRFASGVVARLTCSILASHDHSLRVFCDDGVLSVADGWRGRTAVRLRRPLRIRRRTLDLPWARKLPLAGAHLPPPKANAAAQFDWLRGVADLAAAIRDGRAPRLGPEYSLHVAEIVLAIHRSLEHPGSYSMTTAFEPLEPMEWAK